MVAEICSRRLVLLKAGRIARWAPPPTRKGKGFAQPGTPHRDWHIDVAHLNICGTFYYLCTVLDGYSRFVVHWEIREQMKELDVETILQRAREKFPGTNSLSASPEDHIFEFPRRVSTSWRQGG